MFSKTKRCIQVETKSQSAAGKKDAMTSRAFLTHGMLNGTNAYQFFAQVSQYNNTTSIRELHASRATESVFSKVRKTHQTLLPMPTCKGRANNSEIAVKTPSFIMLIYRLHGILNQIDNSWETIVWEEVYKNYLVKVTIRLTSV